MVTLPPVRLTDGSVVDSTVRVKLLAEVATLNGTPGRRDEPSPKSILAIPLKMAVPLSSTMPWLI
jgi:hypothetical protein